MNRKQKRDLEFNLSPFNKYRNRQRPIFPGGYPPSIVGARSLYDRVRDGNGWYPSALSPINLLVTSYTGSCTMIKLITLLGNLTFRLSKSRFARRSSIVSLNALLNASRLASPWLPHSGKALVRLVMLDYVCCQTSIYILSTSCSATGLTSLCYERSHLMVGFVLICFQHLSTWNTATGRLPLAG